MKKPLIKTLILQSLLGIATVFIYLFLYFFFEQYFDTLIFPISIIIPLLSFVLYRTVFYDFIHDNFSKKQKVTYCLIFIISAVICTAFGMIESDLLNIISITFQQTYYLASEIISDKYFYPETFAIFAIENIIKALIILLPKKKKTAD